MTEKQKKSLETFNDFFRNVLNGKNEARAIGNFIYQYVCPDTDSNRCEPCKSQWRSATADIPISFCLECTEGYGTVKLKNSLHPNVPTVFSTTEYVFFVCEKNGAKCLYILGADAEKHTGAKFYELYLHNVEQ